MALKASCHHDEFTANGLPQKAAGEHCGRCDPWEQNPNRAPTVGEGEAVVFSEHGRSLNNVDFRSHWFMVVNDWHGGYILKVHHGGGEESVRLGGKWKVPITAMAAMSSDDRYLLMHTLYDVHREARSQAIEQTKAEYRRAFTEGRLKKRKQPGQDAYKVWVEAPAGVP